MNLTYPTTLVLHALACGLRHGFDVIAQAGQRPPRRYYELTAAGHAVLATSLARYRVPRTIASRVRRLRLEESS